MKSLLLKSSTLISFKKNISSGILRIWFFPTSNLSSESAHISPIVKLFKRLLFRLICESGNSSNTAGTS